MQLCQGVCKILHPNLFPSANFCNVSHTVGNAERLNRIYAFSLSSSNLLFDGTLFVLRIFRDAWRVPFLITKLAIVIFSCSIFGSYFCGNQACATSAVNEPFCPILRAIRTLHFREISHSPKHSTFPRE